MWDLSKGSRGHRDGSLYRLLVEGHVRGVNVRLDEASELLALVGEIDTLSQVQV